MQAAALETYGGPDVLTLRDLPTPVAGPGEVLVRIVAAGINPVDWKIREGRLQNAFPYAFPLIPGWEMAGVVEAVGSDTGRLAVGDRVWAYCRKPTVQHGTYAQYIALPEANVARMPNILFHEAGSVPLCGLTAVQCFAKAPLAAGSTVLVHAAAGGVGHLAVQLARNAGATVIGTASGGNLDFVASLGAHHVLDYKAGDVREAVRSIAPGGVDFVLDTVGGETQARSFDMVKAGGALISISGTPDPARCASLGITGGFVFVSPSAAQLDGLTTQFEAGTLRVEIAGLYSLARAADAQVESQRGHVRGKLALVM